MDAALQAARRAFGLRPDDPEAAARLALAELRAAGAGEAFLDEAVRRARLRAQRATWGRRDLALAELSTLQDLAQALAGGARGPAACAAIRAGVELVATLRAAVLPARAYALPPIECATCDPVEAVRLFRQFAADGRLMLAVRCETCGHAPARRPFVGRDRLPPWVVDRLPVLELPPEAPRAARPLETFPDVDARTA